MPTLGQTLLVARWGHLPFVFLGGGTSPTSSLPAPALEEAATAREAAPHQKLSEATECHAAIVVAPLPQPSTVEEGAGVAAVAGLSHRWTTTSSTRCMLPPWVTSRYFSSPIVYLHKLMYTIVFEAFAVLPILACSSV